MELAQLLIFKEVAESESINAAVQRLHRVLSNLTTRLKPSESELGEDLFIREKSGYARRRVAGILWAMPDASWR